MPTLRELIADGHVHVFDGAMGTMLYQRGVFVNVCYDELSLRQPQLVKEIHQAYVQAGAGIVADSVPEREFEESINKAQALVRAAELAQRK